MRQLVKFENIEYLNKWLVSKGIDPSSWGLQQTKTIQNLWSEIALCESLIQESPPLRIIHVVQIKIRKGDKILVEGKQNLGSNGTRYRGIFPSEKIKSNENHVDAAIRGLREELQVARKDIRILNSPSSTKVETRESNSYPGLITKYVIYEVEVEIDSLPEKDFWTFESVENYTDPVTRHEWIWVHKGNFI